MRTRTLVLAVALCFLAAAVCFASPQMGTWRLNKAKSKIAPGMPMLDTVVYEAVGDMIKITVDGTDPAGKPIHNEWTGKFDETDYPVIGSPNPEMRSYKVIDANTLEITVKRDGKVYVTGPIVVSADGKTRTIITSGTDAQGKKFTGVGVYDKQ